MSKTVVVTSIFSQQQTPVAQAFHDKGWTVRGTSRSSAPHAFAEIVEADLASGKGLYEAFDGADVVAFTVLQHHRPGAMEAMARRVSQASNEAGVKRIIFNLAGTIDENSDEAPFTEMRAARAAVFKGSVPVTVLQPTVYMDNLLAPWSMPSIVNDGVIAYPIPDDARVSWISHRTLADFVVAAAESGAAAGKEYRIGGPEALTAADLTSAMSTRLGKEVRYYQLPLDVMAAGLNQSLGAPTGDRIVRLYARLDHEPRSMAVDSSAARELNVAPETFRDFVARHEWKL